MRMVIVIVSLILTLAIVLPCGAFLADPLSRASSHSWIAVANFSALSSDGTPARLPVVVPWRDAWMQKPDVIVGHVFLRRVPDSRRVAGLHAITEPMGLSCVDDDGERNAFFDRCWGLEFDLSGKAKQRNRSEQLVQVEAKVENEMVWVRSESFPSRR